MSVDALSLACNIITVTDFGHKFYQTFRDVYRNGEPDPTAEHKAKELAILAESLKKSREKAHRSVPNDDQLFRVADKCVEAATDLHTEMSKLAPAVSTSRTLHVLQSIKWAAKRTWRYNRITQLNKSLDDCEATMQNAILLEMYESGEADRVRQLDDFKQLDSRLQNFVHSVSKQHLQVSQLLVENKSFHQETQAVIRQEVAGLKNAKISEVEAQRLRTSLQFPEMNQRYNELREAHKKSFRWLLGDALATGAKDVTPDRDSGRGSDSSDDIHDINEEPNYLRHLRKETFGDFKQWLTCEPNSKLYWVSGKPGAGKSTLMKYICQQIGNQNAVDGLKVVIRHFFWLGTSNTRSRHNDMESMFMTLLYQLLECQLPEIPLAATILQQAPYIRQKNYPTDWSLEELEETTRLALQILGSRYPIYILLDALDEQLPVAERGELLQIIRKLEKVPNVRLIISSRRERIFDKSLAGSRQLNLQKLTAPDIHYFALDLLRDDVHFDDGYSAKFLHDIVKKIVMKADGVFLWARLAVHSVKRGLIDGNSKDEIYERLNDMPTELSNYFQSIWKRLGDDQKRYQTIAANIFSLLLCSSWEIPFFICWPSYNKQHMKGTRGRAYHRAISAETIPTSGGNHFVTLRWIDRKR
ncbi:uncharacterized protein JN550_002676 [Neoarthrinium moseri]|uniref:uncharacterized protein n=1 Tax=Neoarthrinium moseri TaxID=1658444 RepID=UPI001FDD7ED4|nr:uncharacterized protein JN550_002676 [Neoarthrinium moseri]KAI1874097.1 hypothetical protein JN550_002676 [Neoarthrinium moseri]